MAGYKKKTIEFLLFLYLVTFVFGQIPGTLLSLITDLPFKPHPVDFTVAGIALLTIAFFYKYLKSLSLYLAFAKTFIVFAFSFLLSLFFLEIDFQKGSLYLLRIFFYFNLPFAVFFITKGSKKAKRKFVDSLILTTLAIALLGWLQYLFWPDTRDLKHIGWDDHFFRMLSTFFDPAFTGILLVLGFVLAFGFYLHFKNKAYIYISAFLGLSVFFTYSRSSILSLLVAVPYFLISYYKNKFTKKVFLLLALSLLVIIFLPKGSGGEGVNLLRTKSIELKIENTLNASKIFWENPLFGVGYNNVCAVKKAKGYSEINSHSCNGFDNSFVFLLATTGVVGFLVFFYLISSVTKAQANNLYGLFLKSSFVAVFIHSSFTNTIFYAWVMGWLAILIGLGLKESSIKSE